MLARLSAGFRCLRSCRASWPCAFCCCVGAFGTLGHLAVTGGLSPVNSTSISAHFDVRDGEWSGPSVWFRLVERERWLLQLLADHRVLTTDQIAAIAFGSVRRAQDRLRILRQLGVLFAFRHSYQGSGTLPFYTMLGYEGARMIAAAREEKPPTPGTHREFLERVAASPSLSHLVGANQFSCDLLARSTRDRTRAMAVGIGDRNDVQGNAARRERARSGATWPGLLVAGGYVLFAAWLVWVGALLALGRVPAGGRRLV